MKHGKNQVQCNFNLDPILRVVDHEWHSWLYTLDMEKAFPKTVIEKSTAHTLHNTLGKKKMLFLRDKRWNHDITQLEHQYQKRKPSPRMDIYGGYSWKISLDKQNYELNSFSWTASPLPLVLSVKKLTFLYNVPITLTLTCH